MNKQKTKEFSLPYSTQAKFILFFFFFLKKITINYEWNSDSKRYKISVFFFFFGCQIFLFPNFSLVNII